LIVVPKNPKMPEPAIPPPPPKPFLAIGLIFEFGYIIWQEKKRIKCRPTKIVKMEKN
jgi:hypothetical protein